VIPGEANRDDIFLHLLQVGDTTLTSMDNSIPLQIEDMVGVRFAHENNEYEVMFSVQDKVGGNISIHQNGQKILKENFSDRVKPQ
jgi:hypothetical protein